MKAKDLILITTGLTHRELRGSRGVQLRLTFQRLIAAAAENALNVIVVLGPHGDEVLTQYPELENCDLAFDGNEEASLFTSIKVGLEAATGAAFILPIDEDSMAVEMWAVLDNKMWTTPPDQQADVWHMLTSTADDRVSAWPQLITLDGVSRLKKLPDDVQWLQDSRMRVGLVETPISKRHSAS
jgi:hypothetical protein